MPRPRIFRLSDIESLNWNRWQLSWDEGGRLFAYALIRT